MTLYAVLPNLKFATLLPGLVLAKFDAKLNIWLLRIQKATVISNPL